MGRDGPCGCCGRVFKHHIFIVGYLQFVEGRHLHTALVFNWVWSFSSGKASGQKGFKPQHLVTLRATATVQTISSVTVEDTCITFDTIQYETLLGWATLHISHKDLI
jgi:hypothetical protein